MDSVYLGSFFWSFGPAAGEAFGVAGYNRGTTVGSVPPGQSVLTQAGDKWHTTIVTVRPAGSLFRGTVVVDGINVYETASYSPPQGAADFNAYLGAFYSSKNTGEFEVWFDDVVLQTL